MDFLSSVYSSFLRPMVRRSRTSSLSNWCRCKQQQVQTLLMQVQRPGWSVAPATTSHLSTHRQAVVGVVKHNLDIGRHDGMPCALLRSTTVTVEGLRTVP